jgi:hypothetical protein
LVRAAGFSQYNYKEIWLGKLGARVQEALELIKFDIPTGVAVYFLENIQQQVIFRMRHLQPLPHHIEVIESQKFALMLDVVGKVWI